MMERRLKVPEFKSVQFDTCQSLSDEEILSGGLMFLFKEMLQKCVAVA